MVDELDVVVNDMLNFGGKLFANGTYDVYRPNYSSQASTETKIISSRSGRVEPVSAVYGEPRIQGIENYAAYCFKLDLAVGDVIVPNPAKLSTPVITIFALDDKKETVAFRSNQTGQLLAARGTTPLFTNVRFDWYAQTGTEEPFNPEMAGSPPRQKRKACIIARAGIIIGHRLSVIQSDNKTHYYTIMNIQGTGQIMTLEVQEGGL